MMDTPEGDLREWVARSLEESKRHRKKAAKIPKGVCCLLTKLFLLLRCINF